MGKELIVFFCRFTHVSKNLRIPTNFVVKTYYMLQQLCVENMRRFCFIFFFHVVMK